MKSKRKTRLVRPRGTLSDADIARIASLESRLAAAEQRIAELERQPVTIPNPSPFVSPIPPWWQNPITCNSESSGITEL